jgi:hypothetical protein
LISNTPPAVRFRLGRMSVFRSNMTRGDIVAVVDFVDPDPCVVVVVVTVEKPESRTILRPSMMPCAEPRPGTKARTAVIATVNAVGGRTSYLSPMTTTQYGASPTSTSDITFRSPRLPMIRLLVSGLTM